MQLSDVQRATYGRLLEGRPDILSGYALRPLAITDPEVVRVSGSAVHMVAVWTGGAADRIEGIVLTLTAEELAATDAYEVDYVRTEVVLGSGTQAWLYVAKPG